MCFVVLIQWNSQSNRFEPARRIMVINYHGMVFATAFHTRSSKKTILRITEVNHELARLILKRSTKANRSECAFSNKMGML